MKRQQIPHSLLITRVDIVDDLCVSIPDGRPDHFTREWKCSFSFQFLEVAVTDTEHLCGFALID